jgi:anti-sigma regulatory factor (Ser/Thr protein kinase)
MRLAVGPETAGVARAAIRDSLSTAPGSVVSDTELLATELVTNVVRHAGLGPDDTLELSIDVDADLVRVGVLDHGAGFEKGLKRRDERGGWGLFLVQEVSDRWGVTKTLSNKVWFEIDF